MTIKYSPSTGGFYFEGDKELYLAAGSWPMDLVEVEEARYRDLMSDNADGKTIVAGEDGAPISELVVPGLADILAINEAERDRRLANATVRIAPLQDAVDLELATDNETDLLVEWRSYRMQVNRVDLGSPSPEWPEPPDA